MKNKFFIMILFCILLCCAGCSADHPDGDVSDLHVDGMLNDYQASTSCGPHGVPEILSFASFEQIAELNSIVAQDEETVAEYLDQKGFSMNSLSTKSDVIELFERIGDLNMLHLDRASGYELAGISYYVTYDYIMSTYKSGEDIVRFICYVGAGEELTSSDIGNMESDLVGTFSIGATSVGLYNVVETNSPYALSGRVKTANSRITILLSANDEAKIDLIGANIILSNLMNFITD